MSTGLPAGLTSSYSPPDRPSRRRRNSARPYRPRELREAGVSPSKALGQHFLTDRRVIGRIVAALALSGEETVVEVGPGLGALTEDLARNAGRLIAVEMDSALAQRLREKKLAGLENVSIIEGNVLQLDLAEALGDAGEYILVGNLPYNVGTAILRHFLESVRPPRSVVAMLQREVAEAIVAGPGAMSLVGIGVQVYAEARRLFNVPPAAFYPPPKVHSAVIRLDLRPEPLVQPGEQERFFEVARAGFSAPRKQLRNSLANGLHLSAEAAASAIRRAEIEPTLRPQQLSIADWLRLTRALGA